MLDYYILFMTTLTVIGLCYIVGTITVCICSSSMRNNVFEMYGIRKRPPLDELMHDKKTSDNRGPSDVGGLVNDDELMALIDERGTQTIERKKVRFDYKKYKKKSK